MRRVGWMAAVVLGLMVGVVRCVAQESPLEDVHTDVPAATAPKDARPVIADGDVAAKATSGWGRPVSTQRRPRSGQKCATQASALR